MVSTSATKFAISNQKGGVGKTMVAINLGGGLNQLGGDVLFVDADPQGNATEGLGLAGAYEDEAPNLYTVLVEDQAAIPNLIYAHDEMDVIPSNVDMFGAEPDLITAMRGRERLKRALSYIEDDYDYIIVDTPPWLGILTDSALLACESIVIPALAESTSTRALEILFNQIDTLEAEYETTIHEQAIVANRVEPDGEATELMEWFRETFEPAIPVFEVRKRVALKRAWSHGVSTFAHDEACDMAAVFRSLAETLHEQSQPEQVVNAGD